MPKFTIEIEVHEYAVSAVCDLGPGTERIAVIKHFTPQAVRENSRNYCLQYAISRVTADLAARIVFTNKV